ncbi:RNA family protein [Rutstroemia sp. NJR-2017a WRK4]|nr:RNA family protein [Rutstroemia sp. NJR-2017a WRK4]
MSMRIDQLQAHNDTVNAMSNQVSLCMVRNASINSGINRGLRKSHGVGFRERERGFSRDSNEDRPPRGFGSREDRAPKSGYKKTYDNAGRFDRGSRDEVQLDRGFQPGGQPFRHKTNDRNDKRKPYDKGYKPRTESGSFERKPYQSRGSDGSPFERKPYQSRESGGSSFQRKPYQSRESGGSHFNGKSSDTRGHEPRSFSNRDSSEAGDAERPFVKRENYKPRDGDRVQYERKPYRSRDGEEESGGNKYPSLSSRPPKTSDPSSDSTTGSRSTFEKHMPITIPYTTPASEFLYGTSVVEAALHARGSKSRKLYKLYIYKSPEREQDIQDGQMVKVANKKGVEVKNVSGPTWLRTLDKMSQGRPHNGYVLEASPLPKLPVTSLAEVVGEKPRYLKVNLDYQSAEDQAINGTNDQIKLWDDATGRNPLVLLLDSIVDPQNLGAIIRTAAFMGVAAIAVSTRNSAPFSNVVLKASAGASENMPILSVKQASKFVEDSKAAGWKVYAAVAPEDFKTHPLDNMRSIETRFTDDLGDPLSESPCLLMLGGEGEGLHRGLTSRAHIELSVRKRKEAGKLDSLNVSVAAGILCDAFMRQVVPKTMVEKLLEGEEDKEALDENKALDDNRLF